MLILIFLCTSLLIITGCLIPGRFLPRWLPNDKLLHLGSYFLLMVLRIFRALGIKAPV